MNQQLTGQYGQQQPMYGQQPMMGQGQQMMGQQPMMGQQQMGQQPMMGQQMMGQQMMGQQPMMNQQMMQQIKEISIGSGIDSTEKNAIMQAAYNAYTNKLKPISSGVSNYIKQMIGGEWFVFVCKVGAPNFDFCLSTVLGNDFMKISIGETLFQVCRIKN